MDNQLIYEVVKYIDSLNDAGASETRLFGALRSRECVARRMHSNKKMMEKWIENRESMDSLKNRNIYRSPNCVLNFQDAHDKIRDVITAGSRPYNGVFCCRISPLIARAGKDIDFKLRKKVLKQKMCQG
jgi:hypothetical protein